MSKIATLEITAVNIQRLATEVEIASGKAKAGEYLPDDGLPGFERFGPRLYFTSENDAKEIAIMIANATGLHLSTSKVFIKTKAEWLELYAHKLVELAVANGSKKKP
jgi:hypothetical protein